MASQNPIQTFSTPRPVVKPRAKPLATKARSVGNESSRGLSDHSGRQGKIISITPRVAHKKTNKSTPIRRSHRRAMEGECWLSGTGTERAEMADSGGGWSFETPAVSLGNGSLGSEIIARVV